MDFDLEDFFVQSKSHNFAGLPKEVSTSTHHIEDVKWHAPADSMPQVSLSEINIDLFDAQQGRRTRTHFESTNSTLDNSESKNQNVFASTDLIEDVKCYASADSMPQVNLSESNMDLFSTQPGWQTQTHIKDDDIFGDLKSANSTNYKSESKNQVFTSTHHIEEYHSPADPLPQINLGETNIDLFGSQTGRQQTHTGDEDPFGDFRSTNSILDNSGLEDEVVTSAHHIGDVKWHPLVDSMPQISLNESSVNVFSLDPGKQQTETHTRDDDTFGDFESADSTHGNFESKNLDVSAASFNDYPFNLMEETKASDWNRISHSAFHGQDLPVNRGNNMEHVTPMQGNWFQDDPWSAIITEEKIIKSSNNLKESADLQPDWPETNILADTQDPFAGYIWEQCDTSHFNESATENSRNYTSGENGGAEHNVLFTTDLASQALELDKETTSINGILTEINRFNRVESREANHQAKPISDSLDMEDILVAMPKGSSNDDSGHLIKSLLSEMHDLSFMLADHLVIPDRDGKHSLCL